MPNYNSNFPRVGLLSTNDSTDHAYLPIPRCASTFLLNHFNTNYNWDTVDYLNHLKMNPNNLLPNKTLLCVFREPFQRYLSGVWEYANNYYELFKDQQFIDHLMSKFELDSHTKLQSEYIDFFKNFNIIYFRFDNMLIHNIKHYLTYNTNLNYVANATINIGSPKTKVLEMINEFKLEKHIREYLEPDYRLYKHIKFYEAN